MGQDDNSFFDFVGHDVQLHVSDSEKVANVASSVLEYSHSRHCDKLSLVAQLKRPFVKPKFKTLKVHEAIDQ